MRLKLALTPLVFFVLTSPVPAQFYDEAALCSAIERPGLFYASTQPPYAHVPVNGDRLTYDRSARFVLITEARPRRNHDFEGVWHVRTQTIAEQARRANRAHVFRPPVQTRCPGGDLPAFEGGDRLVALTAYLDHHVSDPDNVRPPIYQLTRRFHMPIQDVEASTPNDQCVWTDDPKKFRLHETYGFEGIKRRDLDTAFEAAATATRRAYASSVTYHGLSSQFAYRGNPGNACVTFSAPIPTGPVPRTGWFSDAYDDALEAAVTWKPRSTLLVVKRLEGRRVVPVATKTIVWKRK